MLNLMTADELAEKTAKGTITTIYGLPDSGKSTFMVTVAEKMKVLFIDAEGKFGKICANVPDFDKFKSNISGIEVKTLKDLIQIVKDPAIDSFEAIVIDSVTRLVDKELHDIMFVQKRRRSFDDYNDLGTNFMGAIEILKDKGISVFFTLQAKNSEIGYSEPDAQGGLVAKKAIEASDWMFFVEEGDNGQRSLSIKNNLSCRLKKKGIPEDFTDALVGKDVKFDSLWDVFPSKPTKQKKITKKQLKDLDAAFEESIAIKEIDKVALFLASGIKQKPFKDLVENEYKIIYDLLVKRTEKQRKLAEVKARTE